MATCVQKTEGKMYHAPFLACRLVNTVASYQLPVNTTYIAELYNPTGYKIAYLDIPI
jgi:hypothetical protein